MRFFRIRELSLYNRLYNCSTSEKSPDILMKLNLTLRPSNHPPYETYSFFTIRSDVVGFGTGSIILSIYVTP